MRGLGLSEECTPLGDNLSYLLNEFLKDALLGLSEECTQILRSTLERISQHKNKEVLLLEVDALLSLNVVHPRIDEGTLIICVAEENSEMHTSSFGVHSLSLTLIYSKTKTPDRSLSLIRLTKMKFKKIYTRRKDNRRFTKTSSMVLEDCLSS